MLSLPTQMSTANLLNKVFLRLSNKMKYKNSDIKERIKRFKYSKKK